MQATTTISNGKEAEVVREEGAPTEIVADDLTNLNYAYWHIEKHDGEMFDGVLFEDVAKHLSKLYYLFEAGVERMDKKTEERKEKPAYREKVHPSVGEDKCSVCGESQVV